MASRIPGQPQVPFELLGRARRFPLELPVLYRQRGEGSWHRGLTANLSRTGVLFAPEGPMPVHCPVELGLLLLKGATAPQVLCRGEIVRCDAGSRRLAARIWYYRFVGGARRERSGTR